jgi:hypothetical protein
MVLPANYNRILYKFREPDLNTENEFLKIKSTETIAYLKKIKMRIKRERQIYIRHHWLSLITYLISTLIVLGILSYILIAWDLKLFFNAGKSSSGYIRLFIFLISLVTSAIYHMRGFPVSLLSFINYINEKINYYRSLKKQIDNCKDFYTYKEKYLRIY